MDRRLIDHFVNANLISRQDMQRIILRSSKDKTTFVEEMLQAQLVHEDVVAQHIAIYFKKETLNALNFRVDPIALNLITGDIAKKGGVLPYAFSDAHDQLYVALFDPEKSLEVLEILEKTTGVPPEIKLAPKSWVEEAIEHYYFRPVEALPEVGTQRRSTKNKSLRSTFVGERSRPRKKPTNQNDGKFDNTMDDLDDFLSEPSRNNIKSSKLTPRGTAALNASHASNFGDMSGLGQGFWEEPGNSKWNWSEAKEEAKHQPAAFDLFNENSVVKEDNTLQQVVERQQARIVKLNEELKRQRDVIQVLADLLIEARVISARELKKRVREKRR